jgi:carboxylesterase
MDIREEGKPFSAAGTNVGCLVMQGFSGTVGGIRYYAQQLAAKGLSVEAPRLTGHGTQWQDLNAAHAEDWIRDAEGAYHSLAEKCSSVFVTGLSLGGTLSLYLVELHPEITGVIPINAPVFMQPGVVEPAYDRSPSWGAAEFLRIMRMTRRGLPKIKQPLLVQRSSQDHVVPHDCAEYILEHVSSTDKSVVVHDKSAHVVTMDYDKDAVVEATWKFIQRLSN